MHLVIKNLKSACSAITNPTLVQAVIVTYPV